jgi:hypothetical protein
VAKQRCSEEEVKAWGEEGRRQRRVYLLRLKLFLEGTCIAGTCKYLGDKSRIGRTELSVIHISNVTSFCWTHSFVNLTPNPALG